MDRIARLRADLGDAGLDALVLTHPPNIQYLTRLRATAGAAIVFQTHTELVVDSRYVAAAHAVAGELVDVSVRLAERSVDDAIVEGLGKADARRIGIEGAHLSVSRFNRLIGLLRSGEKQGSNGRVLVPTERLVERRRAVKDPAEIAILREAARRLGAVARDIDNLLVVGRTEREVAAALDDGMRAAGFERPAFETIVASGPNSALPHARPTARTLRDGEGVLLDFGGIYDGYCVDLSRTRHLGRESDMFRRLFGAVAEAHAAAIAEVKPGALPVDIDGAARRVLARHGLADAFGHGTGHGLGLEVHEEPRISPHTPEGEPVIAGMVFTIEPGVYVPGTGGVRIEDDVLVVEGGCEILTDGI